MKKVFATMLFLPMIVSAVFMLNAKPPAKASEVETIELRTESIDGATHWMPKELTIKAGKKYKLVAKNDLKSGPAFHGLTIKDFGVQTQVNMGQPFTVELAPTAAQVGSHDISCQFHPKHQQAVLKVVP